MLRIVIGWSLIKFDFKHTHLCAIASEGVSRLVGVSLG
jgi:hypothetical protein